MRLNFSKKIFFVKSFIIAFFFKLKTRAMMFGLSFAICVVKSSFLISFYFGLHVIVMKREGRPNVQT